MSDIHQFLIVDGLYERYTVIVQLGARTTSVYCQECETWVAEWPGEQLSTNTEAELYEKIVTEHKHDFPDRIMFSDETVTFK